MFWTFEVSYLSGKVLKQIIPAGNQDSVTLTCFFHVLLLCVAVWNSNHYLSYKICFCHEQWPLFRPGVNLQALVECWQQTWTIQPEQCHMCLEIIWGWGCFLDWRDQQWPQNSCPSIQGHPELQGKVTIHSLAVSASKGFLCASICNSSTERYEGWGAKVRL